MLITLLNLCSPAVKLLHNSVKLLPGIFSKVEDKKSV